MDFGIKHKILKFHQIIQINPDVSNQTKVRKGFSENEPGNQKSFTRSVSKSPPKNDKISQNLRRNY
jgi:hypothetical protein